MNSISYCQCCFSLSLYFLSKGCISLPLSSDSSFSGSHREVTLIICFPYITSRLIFKWTVLPLKHDDLRASGHTRSVSLSSLFLFVEVIGAFCSSRFGLVIGTMQTQGNVSLNLRSEIRVSFLAYSSYRRVISSPYGLSPIHLFAPVTRRCWYVTNAKVENSFVVLLMKISKDLHCHISGMANWCNGFVKVIGEHLEKYSGNLCKTFFQKMHELWFLASVAHLGYWLDLTAHFQLWQIASILVLWEYIDLKVCSAWKGNRILLCCQEMDFLAEFP